MSDDIRSSTCCPSTTPDAENNEGIWDYLVDRNDAHPPPTITCPEDFVAWLKNGQYIVPNFSSAITINGLCQVDSEFTITQQPPAGTVISVGGPVVILIIVVDGHENQVTCDFEIDIHDPNDPSGEDPPTVLPPWIYTPYLLFYYTANDTQCTVGALDEGLPCWFRRDLASLLGITAHHLSNGGDAVLERSQSFVSGFSPGPIFHRGSIWANNVVNGYLYHADDATLQLLNRDFTIRFAFKLVSQEDGGTWNLVGKYDTVGWRVKVQRVGSEYRLTPELKNNSTTLTTAYRLISINTWIYVAMTFKASLGQLKLYIDGLPVEAATTAGFALAGEASQFRIGTGQTSSSVACPVAYWTLDDTNWEDSMNRADLTASDTVNSVGGKIGNGAEFPITTGGKLSFVADSVPELKLLNTDFTVRFWVRVPSAVSNPAQVVGRRSGVIGWAARVGSGAAPYTLDFAIGGTVITTSASLSASTWYHVIWRYQVSDGSLQCYVNGVLVSTPVAGLVVPDGIATFYIGNSTPAVGPVQLDEVGVWARRFSDAQIAADYNSGTGTGFPGCPAANVYTDEIGGWGETWSDQRVADDYRIMTTPA